MNRLSSPIEAISAQYEAVVIGTGYGGAIMASRLARAGLKVCVLERGRERHTSTRTSTCSSAAASAAPR
jgi:cholesterol oxidase